MRERLPASNQYVIVGAGVHGLCTAWHLAMELKAHDKGSGNDIIVLDKSKPGAGVSGLACGCVRNFYMTEAMHPLIRHSVDVWNYDPHAVGSSTSYATCFKGCLRQTSRLVTHLVTHGGLPTRQRRWHWHFGPRSTAVWSQSTHAASTLAAPTASPSWPSGRRSYVADRGH